MGSSCVRGRLAAAVVDRRRDDRLAGIRTGASRGVYTSGECAISSGAPFGVSVARRRMKIATQILVYPRIHDVALPDDDGAGGFGVRRTLRGEAAGVRDYRPGDPPRHVHWRASARTDGELLVREFESGGPVGPRE